MLRCFVVASEGQGNKVLLLVFIFIYYKPSVWDPVYWASVKVWVQAWSLSLAAHCGGGVSRKQPAIRGQPPSVTTGLDGSGNCNPGILFMAALSPCPALWAGWLPSSLWAPCEQREKREEPERCAPNQDRSRLEETKFCLGRRCHAETRVRWRAKSDATTGKEEDLSQEMTCHARKEGEESTLIGSKNVPRQVEEERTLARAQYHAESDAASLSTYFKKQGLCPVGTLCHVWLLAVSLQVLNAGNVFKEAVQ